MRRILTAAAVACVAFAALPALSQAATQTARPASPVVEWNQFLLDLQATPGVQPATIHPTYELAIMHAAIYDAVVSIDRSGPPYLLRIPAPRGASAAAAADAAARDTLTALYPSQKPAIDHQYADALNRLPGGRGRALGARVGAIAAAVVLQNRAHDGSDAPAVPFTPGTQPGDYQLTPPGFAQPVFTQWPGVRPFVLRAASQFRPPAPPALTSPKYAAAIAEVQALGSATGSTRTADQTQIGLFWNPPIWATWNRIAETAALGHRGGLDSDAHTFALLNLTFADSVIGFYDAKYTYRFWRPVTAIRATSDPSWTPLSNTAPDPSYPGAHGTIAAAGADVLAALYGNDFAFGVTSPALPGVERSFTSFSEAAEEASVSRIYNGNHTRVDQVAGENLGRDVAEFVLEHGLRR
jgi:PAP2 superfamily protein